MDSGNSGSMQSSSTAGDEEYDSRADTSSISAILNRNVPPPTTTSLFAPFTHHHALSSDPHMVWSDVARSEPDPPHNSQHFLFSPQSQPRGTLNNVSVGVGVGVFPTTTTLPPESDEQNSTNTNSNTVRNPKKRSRASRRAPTTVLTTDTTNFRAMVQEFTGIPPPPFTSSSPFPRTRLDLFASSSTIIRSTSTHNIDPPTPPYLLRPFPHKLHYSQPSSIPPPLASNTNNNSNNYHPINMHNPILSLLQPPSKYPQQQQQQPSLEIPQSGVGFQELGLSHAHVGNAAHRHHDHNNMRVPSSEAWAQVQAQRIPNNDGGVLRSLSGGGSTLNEKVINYTSDFHGEKGPDCGVAARSEGMVESWINCSSD
ncbi:hypothetical protein Fmac_013983 [Flemingia macrophylla]|uniref:VQ domain-containing protein n=1 Tax=Flemingia macrophylla TaxID=520843 RepID=A0ABD1MAI1_9FABA